MNDRELLALVAAVTEQQIERDAERLRVKWASCLSFERGHRLAFHSLEMTDEERAHIEGCKSCAWLLQFHRRADLDVTSLVGYAAGVLDPKETERIASRVASDTRLKAVLDSRMLVQPIQCAMEAGRMTLERVADMVDAMWSAVSEPPMPALSEYGDHDSGVTGEEPYRIDRNDGGVRVSIEPEAGELSISVTVEGDRWPSRKAWVGILGLGEPVLVEAVVLLDGKPSGDEASGTRLSGTTYVDLPASWGSTGIEDELEVAVLPLDEALDEVVPA